MTMFNFGTALSMLRAGARVTRQGWNARGQCVMLMPGYPDGIPANAAMAKAAGIEQGGKVVIRPYFMLKTADGSYVSWAPSGSDALAEDWYNVSAVPS